MTFRDNQYLEKGLKENERQTFFLTLIEILIWDLIYIQSEFNIYTSFPISLGILESRLHVYLNVFRQNI